MSLTLLRLATAALFLIAPYGASAEDNVKRPVAVVELFTSQGCNACPPADQLLADLDRTHDVVTLAYHVDYWDYLGWKDTLANADNTARQHEYARAFGNRSVYTPQAVVNGRRQMNGAKRHKIEGAIGQMAGTPQGITVDVDASYKGDMLVIETGDGKAPATGAQVLIVYFSPPVEVDIGRGENSGRTLTYRHAVSSFHSAGMWHGKAKNFELPISEIAKKGSGGCAVLVQEVLEGGLPGAILGAKLLYRPSS